LPTGQTTSYFILGDKGRAQLLRGDSSKLSACIQDSNKSKDGLSFASASLIAESILKESSDKTQIVFNRFQSARPLRALQGSADAPAYQPCDQRALPASAGDLLQADGGDHPQPGGL